MTDLELIQEIERKYNLSFYYEDYQEFDFKTVYHGSSYSKIYDSTLSLARYRKYTDHFQNKIGDGTINKLGWENINNMKFSQLYDFSELESGLKKFKISSFLGQIPFYSKNDSGEVLELVIRFQKFDQIPSEIFRLKKLKYLCLRECCLTSVSEEICNLTNIRNLDISNNPLASLSYLRKGLPNLEIFCAESIDLNELNVDDINLCSQLNSLFLQDNPIEIIPSRVFDHKSLWKGWDKMNEIILEKNKVVKSQKYEEAARLRDKERELQSKHGFGLVIDKDNLIMPPEIQWNKKLKDLKLFIRKFEGDSVPINEVKLNVIGEGASGKTSLVKRLFEEDFDANEPQTHGIRISKLNIVQAKDEVSVNIWDFGGQDIMHATHQFFLSKRSLYIIVLDSRKDESVEYWLNHILSFGGDSPVLVVINKIDENPGYDLNRKFLKEKYPNILDFFRVSCSDGEGISELKNGIIRGLENVEHLKMPWTKKWLETKSHLELKDGNYLEFTEYIDLCKQNGIRQNEARVLLEYLHDLGSVVFFTDIGLKTTSVINPEWITNGVYAIINHPLLAENNGELELSLLDNILDKEVYPSEKHNYIIALMVKFELCYKVSERKILIPDLLPVEQPDDLPEEELVIELTYRFIPKSIIANIIVRFKNDIYENQAWRTGVVLFSERLNTRISVILDYRERLIRVTAEGTNKRDYLSIVRYQLHEINGSFLNLGWKEKLVLPDNNEVSISLAHLHTLESAGEKWVFPENAQKRYDIRTLLGSVGQPKEEVLEEIVQMLSELKVEIRNIKDLEKQMHHVLELKPNFFGIGVNLNEILDRFNSAFDKK
ncbi:ADP-ribosylation factor-like protein [Cryomorphaceae bacterium 1068]|nr:ADP-ribosylation factor-like protein [Cryomorphaceae bacterium 1068]